MNKERGHKDKRLCVREIKGKWVKMKGYLNWGFLVYVFLLFFYYIMSNLAS